jgi:sugar lactone lactonase YvrE
MNKPATMQASLVHPSSNIVGEGPLWHSERQSFFWVDIDGQSIQEMTWPGKVFRSWPMPRKVGMIVPEEGDTVIAGLQGGLARFNLVNNQLDWLIGIEKDLTANRPNDGKCDAAGRLWMGTMELHGKAGEGSLYCIDNQLAVTTKLKGLSISNGLAWSLDNSVFYFIDTVTCRVDAHSFDIKTGRIEFKKTVITVPEGMGMPDGMTIDAEGMLWIAHWDGFAVRRWNPANGELLQEIGLPVPQVSSCTFGGKDLDQLFITTAREDFTAEQLAKYPLSGHVFIAEPGCRGTATNKFQQHS